MRRVEGPRGDDEWVMCVTLVISLSFLLGHQGSSPQLFFFTEPSSGSRATERDIQQTLCARKLLAVSPELSALNLIVRCRSGIVTVAGPVHDKAVMHKVLLLLEGMRGVEKITNEMYVGPLGVRPSPLAADESTLGPVQVETRRSPSPWPVPPPQAMGTLTSGTKPAEQNEISSVRKEQPYLGMGSRDSVLAVLELIRAEPRFAGVRYSLNDGMILLEGDSGPEVAMEFAHRLARIPGILGVRISQN